MAVIKQLENAFCVFPAGLWQRADETVSGSVLEAHPAAEKWVFPQVQTHVHSSGWNDFPLAVGEEINLFGLWNFCSRIEAVTSSGQMGSVIRLKQFLEVGYSLNWVWGVHAAEALAKTSMQETIA